VKVFLDECVDWRLARDLVGHQVMTARQMGWASIKNGELLALASQEFDAFVTVDRNLSFQQNLATLTIAVIVLQAPTNRLADLQLLVPRLLSAIASATPGPVTIIGRPQASGGAGGC
jgi:hypothetical protein